MNAHEQQVIYRTAIEQGTRRSGRAAARGILEGVEAEGGVMPETLTAPDTYARQAALERIELERKVEMLVTRIDEQVIERERVRLALRALLTQPITEALPMLIKVARELNPDLPPVTHGL